MAVLVEARTSIDAKALRALKCRLLFAKIVWTCVGAVLVSAVNDDRKTVHMHQYTQHRLRMTENRIVRVAREMMSAALDVQQCQSSCAAVSVSLYFLKIIAQTQ